LAPAVIAHGDAAIVAEAKVGVLLPRLILMVRRWRLLEEDVSSVQLWDEPLPDVVGVGSGAEGRRHGVEAAGIARGGESDGVR
jgi:hypothetical protein